MVLVQRALLGIADRRAVFHQAQGQERFQKTQLVLVDTNRIERAHVERAHFDVFNTGSEQRFGRTLTRTCDAFRTDETVVLVFQLQDVCVELAVLPVDLHPQLLVGRVRSRDRVRQVAHVLLETVH